MSGDEQITLSIIPPQSGTAFVLEQGAELHVVDLQGEQVADLMAFCRDDPTDVLSSGRSIDYAETLLMTRGHVLYSQRSRPMFTIVRDDVGRHDFLLSPCSPETFVLTYKHQGYHPSCLDNLAGPLAAYGIAREAIPTTFNIFMNVEVNADLSIVVSPPLSRAGQRIVLRAERDLIVGLTACSAEMSNNYRFKPIGYAVVPPATSA